MSFTGIWAMMLNNRAKKNSQMVLESLNIRPGDIVADIGSGGRILCLCNGRTYRAGWKGFCSGYQCGAFGIYRKENEKEADK